MGRTPFNRASSAFSTAFTRFVCVEWALWQHYKSVNVAVSFHRAIDPRGLSSSCAFFWSGCSCF